MDDKEDGAAGEAIDVLAITNRFRTDVDLELSARLAAWPPDFNYIQVHEVIGGMLARQATLVKDLADTPPIWTADCAPVVLRAVADVYINIAWLLLSPQERCLQFISFGLGQAKLQLEHYRAEFPSRGATAEEVAMLNAQEEWINSQRATFLQVINLGNWSGTSVRKMAEEAGCLDFCNFVYMPFSACAHSMWHHIARYNLVTCANPLHRHHRWPISVSADPDIQYLLLAAKYWAKTLDTFDERTGIFVSRPTAYAHLIAELTNPPSADDR